jgi:orotidine-5'-phosphate decarboxylase
MIKLPLIFVDPEKMCRGRDKSLLFYLSYLWTADFQRQGPRGQDRSANRFFTAGLRRFHLSLLFRSHMSLLSDKAIPPQERLIFALDVRDTTEARRLVTLLGDSVHFYKIGLQLFLAGGYFELIDWLKERNKKIFADLKIFDVPETVRLAVEQLNGKGISMTTVHGNDGILQAAVAAKKDVQILAVTALTSLDEGDLRQLGFPCHPQELVLSRARRALELGCDGVVSSGLEVASLRENLGPKLIAVTPGIRPVANTDDQKRTVDVRQAFLGGADYIVVGRPIRDAADPAAQAREIQQIISSLFPR